MNNITQQEQNQLQYVYTSDCYGLGNLVVREHKNKPK